MASVEHDISSSDLESIINELFQRAAANPELERKLGTSQESILEEILQQATNPYNHENAAEPQYKRPNVASRRDLE